MKRMFRLRTPLVLLGALLSTVAVCQAQDGGTPEGVELDFSVTGEAKAPPTLLTVRLSGRDERGSAMEAQKALNGRMASAMKLASGRSGVAVQAGAYSMMDQSSDHGRARWVAEQELTLSGKDAAALLDLAGQLQGQGLLMEGLDWTLGDAEREALLAQARTQALEKVRREADESAKTLGMHVLRLKRVQVSSMQPGPRPVMMMAARSMDSAPPQGTPQEQSVHVTVNVHAVLSP